MPQAAGIKKQLVTYKRAEGVPLSFTLYLPANYKPGTKLPTLMWAYPYEFSERIPRDKSRATKHNRSQRSTTTRWSFWRGTRCWITLRSGYGEQHLHRADPDGRAGGDRQGSGDGHRGPRSYRRL